MCYGPLQFASILVFLDSLKMKKVKQHKIVFQLMINLIKVIHENLNREF